MVNGDASGRYRIRSMLAVPPLFPCHRLANAMTRPFSRTTARSNSARYAGSEEPDGKALLADVLPAQPRVGDGGQLVDHAGHAGARDHLEAQTVTLGPADDVAQILVRRPLQAEFGKIDPCFLAQFQQ